MRHVLSSAAVLCVAAAAAAQSPDRELVASISGPAIEGGIVAGLIWDGATLVVQSAIMGKDGSLSARYHAVSTAGRDLQLLASPPAAAARYWKMKSSRVSPTGLGKITDASDSKMPLYGIASQEKRLMDAVDMGGAQQVHELRLNDLVLHRRRDTAPYDGEVWSWSSPDINRIAYVDEKGDVWIAQADGRGAERLGKGHYTLPAWSEDGRLLAVAEPKNDGARWDVLVFHLPERLRTPPSPRK